MKTIKILLPLVFVASQASAGIQFICKTSVDESRGYYIKKTVRLDLKNRQTLFAQPYFQDAQIWAHGSDGQLSEVKKDGTTVYKGFSSRGLFGDISEGAANRGIYLYVSPEIMSGKNGRMTLVARGTEVGLEKGTYSCTPSILRRK